MEARASSPVLAGLRGLCCTEERWLQAGCTFAEQWLFSKGTREAEAAQQFREGIISCLCRGGKEEEQGLPVSYSFVSVTELRSQQRSPCCSHLFWSTDQYSKWTRQGESLLPSEKALPRACLILIGYLTDQICRTSQASEERPRHVDGTLYIRDNSSAVPCEMLHFSLDLLEQLLLFPSWSYLPAPSQGSSGGYLEILAPPISVCPKPEQLISSVEQPIAVLYPHAAAQLLRTRVKGRIPQLNVAGELCRYSSLLDIRGRIFFTLFLKCFSTDYCIPIMVQDPTKVSWHFSLSMGSRYVITGLRVAAVQHSRHKVLQVSAASQLLPFSEGQVREQELPPEALLNQNSAPSKAEVKPQDLKGSLEDKLTPGSKPSKVVSYKGVVTKVLNARAGLYEIDGSVCLCVAYQQLVNLGRGLRPGARIKIRDVHFLQRPSLHFPLVVLCCCLQSVILIQEFSSLCSAYQPFHTSGNLYVSLLLKHHLDLPQYLWMVKTIKDLQDKFCPHFIKQQHLEASVRATTTGIAEKILVPILGSLSPSAQRRRVIEEEIAAEQHRCPLTEYSALKDPCEVPLLSRLYTDAERQGWERLCLPQLLPSIQAQYMNAQELNSSLACSFLTLDAQDFEPRCVLLGVLHSSSRSGSLQLQDESRFVPCLIVKKDGTPCSLFTDTAYIGSVLQVERFQIVVERFIRSNFPSWKQLVSPEYVRKKHSRVYIQFCMEDAVNVGSSVAVSRVPQRPTEIKLQSTLSSCGITADLVRSKNCLSKHQAGPEPAFHMSFRTKVARVMEAGGATHTEPLGGGASGEVCGQATRMERLGDGASGEVCGQTTCTEPLGGGASGEVYGQATHTEPLGGRASGRVCGQTTCTEPLGDGVSGRVCGQATRTEPLGGEASGGVCGWATHTEPLRGGVSGEVYGQATRMEPLGGGASGEVYGQVTRTEPLGGEASGEVCGQDSVSQLFMLIQKEGLLQNCVPIQEEGAKDIKQQVKPTLQLTFQATVVWVGKPQTWAEHGAAQEISEVIDRDWEKQREPQRVLLLFTGKGIRWFPVLHPDCLYWLIVPQCSDVGVFERLCAPTVPVRTLHLSKCSLHLPVPQTWKLHYVTHLESLIKQQDLYRMLARERLEFYSIAEILQPKFSGSLVSFVGEILERTLFEPERKGWIPAALLEGRDEVFLPWEYTLKLTVRDTSSSGNTLHVYINISTVPFPLGLLPTARVYFYNFERKTSRRNNVYCKFVTCSSFSVVKLSSQPALQSAVLDKESLSDSSLPMVFLSQLMLQPEQLSQGCSVCHVVCVLSLGLQWVCSLCGSAFVKGSCGRSGPTCPSQIPVFQAYAKVIVEDGSNEAHVMCKNHQVSTLLHLPPSEWEGLQQHVLRKGHVYIHHRGWSVEHKCTEPPDEDLLTRYLRKLCLSPLICRPVLLSFRLHRQEGEVLLTSKRDSVQMRTFGLERHDYNTRVPAPLSLMCLELQEVDYRVLCQQNSQKIRMYGLGFPLRKVPEEPAGL